MMRILMGILWPSFLVAGVAEGLFFTAFDPMDMTFFGEVIGWSRLGVYTVGFFALWIITAASSALTCVFQRGERLPD
jgi:hypothetical protein